MYKNIYKRVSLKLHRPTVGYKDSTGEKCNLDIDKNEYSNTANKINYDKYMRDFNINTETKDIIKDDVVESRRDNEIEFAEIIKQGVYASSKYIKGVLPKVYTCRQWSNLSASLKGSPSVYVYTKVLFTRPTDDAFITGYLHYRSGKIYVVNLEHWNPTLNDITSKYWHCIGIADRSVITDAFRLIRNTDRDRGDV